MLPIASVQPLVFCGRNERLNRGIEIAPHIKCRCIENGREQKVFSDKPRFIIRIEGRDRTEKIGQKQAPRIVRRFRKRIDRARFFNTGRRTHRINQCIDCIEIGRFAFDELYIRFGSKVFIGSFDLCRTVAFFRCKKNGRDGIDVIERGDVAHVVDFPLPLFRLFFLFFALLFIIVGRGGRKIQIDENKALRKIGHEFFRVEHFFFECPALLVVVIHGKKDEEIFIFFLRGFFCLIVIDVPAVFDDFCGSGAAREKRCDRRSADDCFNRFVKHHTPRSIGSFRKFQFSRAPIINY